jgi:hypothetical protein
MGLSQFFFVDPPYQCVGQVCDTGYPLSILDTFETDDPAWTNEGAFSDDFAAFDDKCVNPGEDTGSGFFQKYSQPVNFSDNLDEGWVTEADFFINSGFSIPSGSSAPFGMPKQIRLYASHYVWIQVTEMFSPPDNFTVPNTNMRVYGATVHGGVGGPQAFAATFNLKIDMELTDVRTQYDEFTAKFYYNNVLFGSMTDLLIARNEPGFGRPSRDACHGSTGFSVNYDWDEFAFPPPPPVDRPIAVDNFKYDIYPPR